MGPCSEESGAARVEDSADPVLSLRLALLLLVVLTSLGALYLTVPASPDQFELDYAGWLVLSGAAPYVDFIMDDWPGSFWLHALSTFLFGNETYSWRVIDYFLMVVCVAFLADLLRRTWGREAARWALFLYPMLYVSLGCWFAGQRDFVAAHLMFICLWADHIAWSQQRVGWQIVAGVAIGLATLVKPIGCVIGLVFVALTLFARHRQACAALRHILTSATSAFGTIAIGVAILLMQGSSIPAIWQATFLQLIPPYRHDGVDGLHLLATACKAYFISWHWIAIGALLTVAFFFRRPRTGSRARPDLEAKLLFPLMFGCGIVSFVVQGRGFAYHLSICYAATVVLLCIGLGRLSTYTNVVATRFHRVVAILLIAIAIAGTGKKLATSYSSVFTWICGSTTWQEHLSHFPGGQGLSFQQVATLASQIRKSVPPDETVLVWPTASSINFLAQRRQPTRFIYYPTLVELDPSLPLAKQWAKWFAEDLEHAAPRICVVSEGALRPTAALVSPTILYLQHYLDNHYIVTDKLEGETGPVARVYLRKGNR